MLRLFLRIFTTICNVLSFLSPGAFHVNRDQSSSNRQEAARHAQAPRTADWIRQDRKFPGWMQGMSQRERDLWEDVWDAG